MPLAERVVLYQQLENHRKRPLIVYVTSSRHGISSMMAADAIPELQDQLQCLPDDTKAIDLLVISNGGDPTVAWRAITLLRERVDEVAVLVPQAAYSAATLLALGANQIVMHPNGNLGPVDPQISVKKHGDKEAQQFGFEELAGFLEFAKNEVGLTDQEHRRGIFDLFCKEVGAVPVGVAARSSLLSLTMGEKLLRTHMKGEADVQRTKTIAESLNKAFFHHGYPVGRKEAKEIGLPVAESDIQAERLMWAIWKDLEAELKIRQPFSPLFELMNSSEGAKLFTAVPQLNAPPNLPQAAAQQLLQQVMQNAIVNIDSVDFEIITTVMESRRLASMETLRGKILACRMPDLNIRVNAVTTKAGWELVGLPAQTTSPVADEVTPEQAPSSLEKSKKRSRT
jgi:hypothetical protein